METSTDRIEKKILLRAPRSRVWRALTHAEEFGAWFGVKLEGAIAPHARLQGQITHPGYEHLKMDLTIDRVDPEHLFSYRWHPYAVDPKADYTQEATTLVEFQLAEVPDGVLLTVVESGFDQIPPARRAEAYRMNTNGWAIQLNNIEKHVAAS